MWLDDQYNYEETKISLKKIEDRTNSMRKVNSNYFGLNIAKPILIKIILHTDADTDIYGERSDQYIL